MTAGLERHWDVTDSEAYHADKTAISSSQLRFVSNCGTLAYWHAYLADRERPPREDSEALILGQLFHSMAEGKPVGDNLTSEPTTIRIGGLPVDLNRRLKAHREYMAEWKAEQIANGLTIVPDGTIQNLTEMAASMGRNPEVKRLLEREARHEHAVKWVDKGTGLLLKALADVWFPKQNTLLDFKTTRHHTPAQFCRDARTKGYHQQAGHYCDGFESYEFTFVSVRNAPPYECLVYQTPMKVIQLGRALNRDALADIKQCMETGSWHSEGHGKVLELEI